jgi:hypothetical protein
MAGRRAVLAIFVGATVLVGIGSAAISRTRQAHRERELVLAWKTMGWSLNRAASRLGLDCSKCPDAWDLASAPSDTAVQARLDSLEARVWRQMGERKGERGLDSLREGLRRDREHLGLALAHCRQGTRSIPSKWFLAGFPSR